MALTNRLSVTRPAFVAVCVASAAVGAVIALLSAPDRWLPSVVSDAHGPSAIGKPIADVSEPTMSDDFRQDHLRYSDAATRSISPLSADLQPGDHITIGGKGGLKRVFKVTEVRRLRTGGSGAYGFGSVPMMLVIAVDVERPEEPPIRVFIEDTKPLAAAPGLSNTSPRT